MQCQPKGPERALIHRQHLRFFALFCFVPLCFVSAGTTENPPKANNGGHFPFEHVHAVLEAASRRAQGPLVN